MSWPCWPRQRCMSWPCWPRQRRSTCRLHCIPWHRPLHTPLDHTPCGRFFRPEFPVPCFIQLVVIIFQSYLGIPFLSLLEFVVFEDKTVEISVNFEGFILVVSQGPGVGIIIINDSNHEIPPVSSLMKPLNVSSVNGVARVGLPQLKASVLG
jgi:hypothetical protein